MLLWDRVLKPQFKKDYLQHKDLRRLLKKDDPTLLEIGASDGGSTHALLLSFPHAEIYAFEPEPRALKIFKSRNFSSQVHLYETAIGAVNGQVDFYQSDGSPDDVVAGTDVSDGWHYSGSIRKPAEALKTNFDWLRFDNKITVDISSVNAGVKTHHWPE